MAAPFAALEQAANTAVMARLANAQAQWGGRVFGVIHDAPYASPFDAQVDAADHVLHAHDADVAGIARGDEITLRGRVWRVITVEPDGGGLTRLVLGEH